MDTKEGMSKCRQCHKMVAEANFALHETHCERFLCLCPECDETVPREQLDRHREKQHTLVKCSKCNLKVERCFLMDHESDLCPERLQPCVFCKLALPRRELDQHQYTCGSRTELCGDCRRYVTLREQPVHQRTCPAALAASPTNSDPSSDSKKNSSALSQRLGVPNQQRAPPPNALAHPEEAFFSVGVRVGGGGDRDHIGTCPHCGLTLPVPTLLRHQVKCLQQRRSTGDGKQ